MALEQEDSTMWKWLLFGLLLPDLRSDEEKERSAIRGIMIFLAVVFVLWFLIAHGGTPAAPGSKTVIKHADAEKETVRTIGPKETVIDGSDGSKTIATTYADGDKTTATTYADGTKEFVCPDGTKKIERLDGTKETVHPDGTKRIVYANGTRENVDADGTKRILYDNGTSETVHPNGTKEIDEIHDNNWFMERITGTRTR